MGRGPNFMRVRWSIVLGPFLDESIAPLRWGFLLPIHHTSAVVAVEADVVSDVDRHPGAEANSKLRSPPTR